jgi:integrase
VFTGARLSEVLGLRWVWIDLRHNFASVAVRKHMGLPIVGKMLGHTQAQTTLRYAHFDSDPVGEAAKTVAAHIDAAMEGRLSSPDNAR